MIMTIVNKLCTDNRKGVYVGVFLPTAPVEAKIKVYLCLSLREYSSPQ